MPGLAVDQVAEILEKLESHPLLVTPELCTRQRHRLSTCTRCFDACPVGAITWGEGLQIDREACTGCGICAAVCPTGALEAQKPTNDELLVEMQRVLREQDQIAFVCPRVPVQGQAQPVRVGCLGRIDEALLLSAVAHGAQEVWLVDGACKGCPQAVGRAIAEKMATRANMLLEALGLPARAAFRQDLPSSSQVGEAGNGSGAGVSRRGLFKALARETARVGEVTVETAQAGRRAEAPPTARRGDLPKALPTSRLLLLAALKRLGSPAVAALDCGRDGSLAQFQLGEGCTGCQMCAFFCPTGALTRVAEDGRIGLAFRTSHCTNCGLCRDICYRDAALLSSEVDLNKVMTLAVDWCFAQEMDAEPWKTGPGEGAARQMLEAMRRQI